MGLLLNVLASTLAVAAAAYVLPGATIDSPLSAFGTAMVLGLINATLRPLLLLLTLPINVMTLGLLTFVIMGGLVQLAAAIVPGFDVSSFWSALGFAIILALINMIL